ncbi:hypothetical protein ACWGI9_42700 [Streptomyces sp. NPDC054833]
MPQEELQAVGVPDAVTAYEEVLRAFAEELREFRIRCGQPKQAALIESAKSQGRSLHPATLSDVLNGKKAPAYDFLADLIRQLVKTMPGLDYPTEWKHWEGRWQKLARAKGKADRQRKAMAGQQQAQRRREADNVLAQARTEAERMIEQASRQAGDMLRAAAAQAAHDERVTHAHLQITLADEAARQRQRARDEADRVRARALRDARRIEQQARAHARRLLREADERAEWASREGQLRAVIEAEDIHQAAILDLQRRRERSLAEAEDRERALEDARQAQQVLGVKLGEEARQHRRDARLAVCLVLKAQAVLQQAQARADLLRAEAVQESQQARERLDEEIKRARIEAEATAAHTLQTAEQALERAEREAAMNQPAAPVLPAKDDTLARALQAPLKAGEQPAKQTGNPPGVGETSVARALRNSFGADEQPAVQTGNLPAVRPAYASPLARAGAALSRAATQMAGLAGRDLASDDVTQPSSNPGDTLARIGESARVEGPRARLLPTDGLLDQVLFRWEGARGRAGRVGMAPVAYSCSAQNAERVLQKLDGLLRPVLHPGQQPSLVRCVIPGSREVAVLARIPAVDPAGRASMVVHALLGSADVLTAHGSIMLHPDLPDWTGVFQDSTGRLPRLSSRAIRQRFIDEEPHYRAAVVHIQRVLEAAAAQLIRTPDHRLSFDQYLLSTDHARLLIWALCTLFGPWLGDDTFTYVSRDGDDSLPLKLICVPEWQPRAYDTPLSRVAPERPADKAGWIAEDLVRQFILDLGNPEKVHSILAQCPDPCARTLTQRIETLAGALRRVRAKRLMTASLCHRSLSGTETPVRD